LPAFQSLQLYATYPTVLTIVHCDGTYILSLHTSQRGNLRGAKRPLLEGNQIFYQIDGNIREFEGLPSKGASLQCVFLRLLGG
jgi:hypothetical protein